MKVVVWTTPEADAQAAEADSWWRENRSAAPDLFLDELAGAFDLIAQAPEIGTRYREGGVPGLRRVLMPRSRYHVYYVHDPDKSQAVVLAVWSAVRGRGPRFNH